MDKIEHDLSTAGFEIEQRIAGLRPIVAEIGAVDAVLSAQLDEVLGILAGAGQRLVSVASSWHYVER